MPVFFATHSTLSYCDGTVGYPDGSLHVMLEDEAFALLDEQQHDRVRVSRALGLPDTAWQGHRVYLVKVPQDKLGNVRMPSGNETGVDNGWLPGGVHRLGFRQAVIDPLPLADCMLMELTWKS